MTTKNDLPAYGKISIGNDCWFAMKCVVLKGSLLPDHSIIGANSLINKDYSKISSYCLLADQPAVIKKNGIYRDKNDDCIVYCHDNVGCIKEI